MVIQELMAIFEPKMRNKIAKKHVPHLLVGVFALVIIYLDWLLTDAFRMEGSYVLVASVLLVSKLFDHYPTDITLFQWVSPLINASLILLTVLNFLVLAIALFGFGFTTGKVPMIWYLSLLANVGVLVSCIAYLATTIKRARTENK